MFISRDSKGSAVCRYRAINLAWTTMLVQCRITSSRSIAYSRNDGTGALTSSARYSDRRQHEQQYPTYQPLFLVTS